MGPWQDEARCSGSMEPDEEVGGRIYKKGIVLQFCGAVREFENLFGCTGVLRVVRLYKPSCAILYGFKRG